MRIGDADIPLAHTGESVVSNAAYVFGAVGVASVFGWSSVPVSLALIVQAFGSTLFHATRDRSRWAQMLDATGIQWVMTALLALGVAKVYGFPLVATYAALALLWPLLWLYIHWLPRVLMIALESVVLLYFVGVVAGVSEVIFLAALTGGAVALQRLRPTHSLGHTMWHLLSAGAQVLAVAFLIG